MSTLGEKVTETIVGAMGRGLTGFTASQHADLKSIVAPRVEEYLALLPAGSPARQELERLTHDSTISDTLLMLVGAILGVIQSIWTMGEPVREALSYVIWQAHPWRQAPAHDILLAAQRGLISPEDAANALQQFGFAGVNQLVLDAALQRPLDPDQIRDLSLRGELPGGQLQAKLRAAGLSAEDQGLILKLFWRIPPVQDIIRMAVREAFTPEIAERFGQYQDFPSPLAEYAAKQGLSTEWARRYWAAHWDLPSLTMGYEMLHRGAITESDLDLLMRAQDVMPFWRDKLKLISYHPLTRVDVRRMYHLGVLNDDEVRQAYRDLGYNDVNAERMLEFTRAFYGAEDEDVDETDRELTKSEILDGYRKRIITADQARVALRELNYPDDKVDFYLAREDLKSTQALKDAYLTRYKALYVSGILSADQASQELETLGLGIDEINSELGLWHLQRIAQVQRPTKAELIRWLKAGIISQETWIQEMRLSGFDERYISWYLAELAGQPELAIQAED